MSIASQLTQPFLLPSLNTPGLYTAFAMCLRYCSRTRWGRGNGCKYHLGRPRRCPWACANSIHGSKPQQPSTLFWRWPCKRRTRSPCWHHSDSEPTHRRCSCVCYNPLSHGTTPPMILIRPSSLTLWPARSRRWAALRPTGKSGKQSDPSWITKHLQTTNWH